MWECKKIGKVSLDDLRIFEIWWAFKTLWVDYEYEEKELKKSIFENFFRFLTPDNRP